MIRMMTYRWRQKKEAAKPAPQVQTKPKPKPRSVERITPNDGEETTLQFMGRSLKLQMRPSVIIMVVVLVMIMLFGGSILFSLRRGRSNSHAIQMEEEIEL